MKSGTLLKLKTFWYVKNIIEIMKSHWEKTFAKDAANEALVIGYINKRKNAFPLLTTLLTPAAWGSPTPSSSPGLRDMDQPSYKSPVLTLTTRG